MVRKGVGLRYEDVGLIGANIGENVITIGECALIKVSTTITRKRLACVSRAVAGKLKGHVLFDVFSMNIEAEIRPVVRSVVVLCSTIGS